MAGSIPLLFKKIGINVPITAALTTTVIKAKPTAMDSK